MRKFIILLFFIVFSTITSAGQPIAYGPTTNNDQLWQIAISLRPNTSITVEQTMLAILTANPKAFIDGNIYRLKSGYVLAIPTIDIIKKISAKSAAKEVERQHNAFLGKGEPSISQQEIKPKQELKKNDEQENQFTIENLKEKIAITSQQYQERLDTMEQQNQGLRTNIEQINSNLDHLRQELKTLHEKSHKQHQIFGFLYSYSQWAHNFFDADGLKLLAALALLLIIWWSFLHHKQSKLENTNYDFMSGEEGMNAKLDLAQAYIDMNDKESARKVLAEVKGFGNNKQKTKAQELLKKMR